MEKWISNCSLNASFVFLLHDSQKTILKEFPIGFFYLSRNLIRLLKLQKNYCIISIFILALRKVAPHNSKKGWIQMLTHACFLKWHLEKKRKVSDDISGACFSWILLLIGPLSSLLSEKQPNHFHRCCLFKHYLLHLCYSCL